MKQADVLRCAKDCLDKLDNYTDPISGQRLPDHSVGREEEVHKVFSVISGHLGLIIAHDDPDGLRPFSITPEQIAELKPAGERMRDVDLVESINERVDMTQYKRLTVDAVKGWLRKQGYLTSGKSAAYVELTPQGSAAGIALHTGKRGIDLHRSGQQLIFDHLEDIARYGQTDSTQEKNTHFSMKPPECVKAHYRTMLLLSQGRHPVTEELLATDDPVNQGELRKRFSCVAVALARAQKAGSFTAKTPFSLPPELWAQLPASQPMRVSEFCRRASDLRPDPTATEELTWGNMCKFLHSQGLAREERTKQGDPTYPPTPEGIAWGITKMKLSQQDNSSGIVCFSPAAQEHLARHMAELIAFCAR